MKARAISKYVALVCCLTGAATWQANLVHGDSASASPNWDRQAAARYLDDREVWWQQWPRAQKDHGTICISCHTNVPYAMARPTLVQPSSFIRTSSAFGTPLTEMSEPEKAMLGSVEKRVANWSVMEPFYSDAKNGPGKTAEAHATEAVLNAIILASYDASLGHLRPVTRTAFDELWALQELTGDRAGAWKWQDFHLGPWESSESAYQGAALLLIATLNAPEHFAGEPETRRHLDRLRDYLRAHYASQPLINRMYILWAAAGDPALLDRAQRKSVVGAIYASEQADGGWRTTTIDQHERIDYSPAPTESDGYATGLAVLALEEAGKTRGDHSTERGLRWLVQHQQKDGAWNAASINKQRDPATDAALFMQDAATAYAALALEHTR